MSFSYGWGMDASSFDWRGHAARTALFVAALLAVSCRALGPGNVARDRFNYNQVVGQSNNEQMLLNLVRMRYRDVPVFMAVSSVLTQYVYSAGTGISGVAGTSLGDSANSIGGTASVRYLERPTITYSPMTGPEFAEQMLQPIPAELLFSLAASGWPAEELLSMGLARVNGVRNFPFRQPGGDRALGKSPSFERLVGLVVDISLRGGFEMQSDPKTGDDYLVLVGGIDAETDSQIDEFRRLTGLDPTVSRYRVVSRRVNRGKDEVTMRMRSLLALMGALARGVEIPQAHRERGLVEMEGAEPKEKQLASMMTIHTSEEPPLDAFVSVEYQGQWFYLESSDTSSREAFGLVTYLFLMMASKPQTADPVITIPAG